MAYSFEKNILSLSEASTLEELQNKREWIELFEDELPVQHSLGCICNNKNIKKVSYFINKRTKECAILGGVCKKKVNPVKASKTTKKLFENFTNDYQAEYHNIDDTKSYSAQIKAMIEIHYQGFLQNEYDDSASNIQNIKDVLQSMREFGFMTYYEDLLQILRKIEGKKMYVELMNDLYVYHDLNYIKDVEKQYDNEFVQYYTKLEDTIQNLLYSANFPAKIGGHMIHNKSIKIKSWKEVIHKTDKDFVERNVYVRKAEIQNLRLSHYLQIMVPPKVETKLIKLYHHYKKIYEYLSHEVYESYEYEKNYINQCTKYLYLYHSEWMQKEQDKKKAQYEFEKRIYFNVPFAEKDSFQSYAGTQWDATKRKWYSSNELTQIELIQKWPVVYQNMNESFSPMMYEKWKTKIEILKNEIDIQKQKEENLKKVREYKNAIFQMFELHDINQITENEAKYHKTIRNYQIQKIKELAEAARKARKQAVWDEQDRIAAAKPLKLWDLFYDELKLSGKKDDASVKQILEKCKEKIRNQQITP
jgi:hypothetical protein